MRLAQRHGVLTSGEATRRGIHGETLTRLVRKGEIERIDRGQYRIPGRPATERHTLAIVARAAPGGVICLLSAMNFHDLGSELPAGVWLAIDRKTRPPSLRYPPIRIVRFGGEALMAGVETHHVDGAIVKVYGVAKTVADLFKYRNKIGLNVALEALREAWRDRRVTIDELDRYARICRVRRVMTPYMEAMTI